MAERNVRAALYCRVSTVEQTEGTSLDSQRKRCLTYIAAHGWDCVGEFVDEGVSGAKDSRPALDRLLRQCAKDQIDAVVVARQDRFMRSTRHFLNLMDDFQKWGVGFVSLAEAFDASTPTGRLMMTQMASLAEYERELIRERTMSGLRAIAAEGYWAGGPPPYGYRTVQEGKHKRLALDDREADVIRRATTLVLDEGKGLWTVAATLNAMGLTPRRAARWEPSNLRRTLLADHLSGQYTWAKPGRFTAGGHAPILVSIVPLLSVERHAALRAALHSRSTGPKPKHRTYPLTGLLFGTCGGGYSGVFRRDRMLRQYRCRQSLPLAEPRCSDRRLDADDVETVVWQAVCDLLGQPERLLALAGDYLGQRREQVVIERDQLADLDVKIAAHERALTDAVRDYLRAGVDAGAVKAATADLDKELKALRSHRSQLEAWRATTDADSERMRRLWKLADEAHTRLLRMTPEDQAAVLDLLDVEVRVTGWTVCTSCGSTGRLRRIPCGRCHRRGEVPAFSIEGTVYDRLLDSQEGGGYFQNEAPRRSTCCRQ